MEDLLIIEGEELTINPHFLGIKLINNIWKRDHGSSQKNPVTLKNERVKHLARKELHYIWFMENWKSPFMVYTNLDSRYTKVVLNLGFSDTWKEDNELREARQWYAEHLVELNPEIKGLNSSRKAIGAIEDFLDKVNLLDSSNRMPNGAAIYKPKDIANAVKELNITKKSVREIEEAVRKAMTVTKKMRGGGEAGRYEN